MTPTRRRRIGFAAKEREGARYAREVLPLVALAQRQRELVAAAQLRGGSPASVAEAGGDWPRTCAAYGERVDRTLAQLTQAADGSSLTLAPDLDSYYPMDSPTGALPVLVEATLRLGDMARAVARGLSVSAEVTHDRTRAETLGDFNDERWAAAMPKVYALHPALKDGLRDETVRHELHALLAARQSALESQRAWVSLVVLLSLLTATYLFYSFHLVTHGGLREVQKHLEAMTASDLTTQPRPWGRDEAARLMGSLADMQRSLRTIVNRVRGVSDNIVHSTAEISDGSMDLSARAEQAAATSSA